MFKKVYIIAEIGSSHDGSFGNACNMIIEASKSGADAVKFQTHIAEEETLENSPNPPYFKSENRFSYFKRTSFSFIQLKKLKLLAKKYKIDFLSSSFSIKALKILEKLDIKFHKVPSGELSNTPLLERIAKTKKITFLSTGMSNWSEIDQAVKIFQDKKRLVLMQCTSLYPCPLRYAGINLIKKMRNRYNLTIGFSDHTLGSTASVAAVLKGVKVIEKHFTLSNKMYGSDAAHSLNPDEFKIFSNDIRSAEIILKSKMEKRHYNFLRNMKMIFEKSIVSSRNLKKGTILSRRDLSFKKPGTGISAKDYKKIIGLRIKKSLKKDQIIRFDFFH